MLKLILALSTLALTLTAKAAPINELKSCEEAHFGLTEILAPSADTYRAFYNNQVNVYAVDTIEPACCSQGLAIVIPDQTAELGGVSKCFAIGHLSGVSVKGAKSSYDAVRGLLIAFPVKSYDPETGATKPAGLLKVRVNLKTATVILEN